MTDNIQNWPNWPKNENFKDPGQMPENSSSQSTNPQAYSQIPLKRGQPPFPAPIKIDKVDNGYILTVSCRQYVFKEFNEVLSELYRVHDEWLGQGRR